MTFTATRGSTAGHWVTIICALLSLAGATTTAVLSYRAQSAPSNVEMTKLALGMLKEPDTPKALREWAIDILGAYTDVPVSAERRSELADVIQQHGGVDLGNGQVTPVDPAAPVNLNSISPELKDISKTLQLNLPDRGRNVF